MVWVAELGMAGVAGRWHAHGLAAFRPADGAPVWTWWGAGWSPRRRPISVFPLASASSLIFMRRVPLPGEGLYLVRVLADALAI